MKPPLAWVVFVYCLSLPGWVGGDDEVTVPKGVVYKTASKELNDQAKAKISAAFSEKRQDADIKALFGKALMCGPSLWEQMKDDPELSKLGINVEHKVPQFRDGKVVGYVTRAARAYSDKEQIMTFWKVFARKYDFAAKMEIRKLTAPELSAYWAEIPFDIEEPIFMVASGKRRILLDLDPKALEVAWIDDFGEEKK